MPGAGHHLLIAQSEIVDRCLHRSNAAGVECYGR